MKPKTIKDVERFLEAEVAASKNPDSPLWGSTDGETESLRSLLQGLKDGDPEKIKFAERWIELSNITPKIAG